MSEMVNTYGVREMPRWRAALSRAYYWMARQRRRFLPYLVWYGDELDVRVTFTADKLPPIEGPDLQAAMREAFTEFQRSPLVETEEALRRLGVGFDTGMGGDGREWEWDFSLSGPISVQFKRRARRPERRTARKAKTQGEQ